MKVLSWDVGIINLAYCLLEITYIDDKVKYHIYDWGLIDLSKRKDKICNICSKKANMKYFDINEEKDIYCCKIHAKKYCQPDMSEINSFFTNDNNNVTCDLCDKECKRQYKSHNFCSNHGRTFYTKLCKNIKLVPFKQEKNNFDIDRLRHTLVEELEKKTGLFSCDKVLIENQPSLKNPRMKSISSTIYDYYLIRGVFDKKHDSKITRVKYMSPSNKIKLSKDKKLVKEADKSQKYKLTKKLAVDYVKEILDNSDDLNNFKSYFLSEKKKDDLADAFLQGAYYLTYHDENI